MIRLALCSALSDRAAEGKVLVVDDWGIDEPRTKDALAVLGALGLREPGERDARLLVVLDSTEEAVWKSFRNLGDRVQIVLPRELNAYDVLVNDWLVFSAATLEATVRHFGAATEDETPETPETSEAPETPEPTETGDDE